MGQLLRLSRGLVKPYNSRPWIDWSHPLTKGLSTYCYDVGGVIIDLVSGGVITMGGNGTAPFGSQQTQFGRGLQFPLDGWGFMPPFTPGLIAPFGGSAPYSAAMGTIFTGRVGPGFPDPDGCCVSVQDAGNSTATAFGFNTWAQGASGNPNAGDSITCCTDNNQNSFFNQIIVQNTFQSWGMTATTSTGYDMYSGGVFDSTSTNQSTSAAVTNGQIMYNTASINSGQTFGNGDNGYVSYFGMWGNRALKAPDFLSLAQAPWQFLNYSEDEMLSLMAGITSAPSLQTLFRPQSILVGR